MTTLSTSSKELLTKICQDFCSLAVYRPATYQQRFSQAYIYNFFKGNYSYSLNNYNEIFRFIQTNKKEEWELSELPEPPKKKFRGDTQMIQSAEQSYTWGQNYKNHLGENFIKVSPITGDELYPAVTHPYVPRISIKIKEDADLINDPENLKAAAIQKHTYKAINKKKRKK